jgi:tetratricopeptide (TPR) repeat protein
LVLRTNLDEIRDWLLPGHTAGNGGAASAIKSRHSIAVLGFKNVSGRAGDAWLSTALSEMITTELAAGGQLRAVPGESVARMKISLSLSDADSYGEATLSQIRTNLNADHVVLGSYIPLGGGQLRLDMRLQDTAAGEILLAASVKGDEAQIDNLVSRAGAQLRDKLGVGQVSPEDAVAVRATLPQSRDAARLYSTGLQRLRQFDYLRARESLELAVAAEPQYALAYSALAVALKSLGYDNRAGEQATKARELSAGFSREERLWIEGQSYEITNRWSDAIDTYKTLVDFFPDNLDYGLRLATAQISAAKGTEALATIEMLRKLPSPGTEEARIDLTEAAAAKSVGDFKKQKTLASIAVDKADSQGVRLLAAQARISDCEALRYLGKPKESILRCEEARKIFAAAGDRNGVARALNTMAVAHMEQGALTEARKAYEEALSFARELGDKKTEAMVQNNLAGALRGQVDLAGSRKMLEQALASFRAINDKGGIARSLDNIGIVLMDEGKPEAARKRYEESLAVCREIGNKSLSAHALYLIGEVHAVQGNLAASRKSHTEAFALRKEISDQRALAQSDLALAGLSIEAEQFASAESAARERMNQFQKVNASDDEALARAVLARALLAQGKTAEAREVSNAAVSMTEKAQDTSVRLTVTIQAARVRAESSDPAELAGAKKSLAAAVAEAAKEGLTGLLLEARLALGEIEVKSGDRAAGRAHLAALQTDATAKGYLLIARKASAARR